LYFRDNPTRNVVMQYYDAQQKTGNKVAVEEYTSQIEPRLTRRIEADKIRWDSSKSVWELVKWTLRGSTQKLLLIPEDLIL